MGAVDDLERRPVVTVLMPFLNAEKTIGSAVRSVFAQSMGSWELLLIDDGSTDQSLSIVAEIKDPRARVVSDARNMGLVSRLNQGVGAASGKFIARLDSDDIMHPDRLAVQLRTLQKMPEVDLVSSAAWIIDESDGVLGKWSRPSRTVTPEMALTATPILHPTVLGRTEWFRAHPYDERFPRAEDRDLWVRSLLAGSCIWREAAELTFIRRSAPDMSEKWLRSWSTDRRILATYGPEILGPLGTMYHWCRSHAISTRYAALRAFGKHGKLIRPPTAIAEHDLTAAQAALRRVKDAVVPGWPHARAGWMA